MTGGSDASRPAILFAGVHKRFDDMPVLHDVSFAVRDKTVHFVIGKSGVGKSVLIKHVIGLVAADAGRIEVGGVDVTRLTEAGFFPIRARCQMIFQQATLFDAMSVEDNVAMPLRRRFRLSAAAAARRAAVALARAHADHLGGRYSTELGPGQKKQVAIARALALEPEILLYDEPTTGLDPVAASRTDLLIRDTARDLGLTSVVVSHDLASVRAIGDWVTFLHEGRVRFDGTPQALFASDDPVVRDFIDPRRQQPPASP